ncbi:MAG TPA: FtsX-like permease family protein, partial [Acidimicrobiales bacterium]|nr:FtsX-like permease family protein [Acidimicrobiales bacterium]
ASATELTGPAGGVPTCSGCRPINSEEFSLFDASSKELPEIAKLVAGHMPDPAQPNQVLASFTLQRDDGVHIGSVIHIPLYAPSQRTALTSGAPVAPDGRRLALHVVGIEAAQIEFPSAGTPSYDLFTTQALARESDQGIPLFYAYFVRLRHGAADLPAFEFRARQLGAQSVSDLDTSTTAIEASIHPQVIGWWILAGLTTLVGLIVVAQALSRQAEVEADTFDTLSALGVSRRQLVMVGMARSLAIAVVGVTAGVLLAFLLSPLTPVGEARLAEPSPGFDVDIDVLLLVVVVALVAVLVLGLWPAIRSARVGRRNLPMQVPRPSRIIAGLTAAGAPPSLLMGVRHALERGRGRNAIPVGSALIGSVLAVTALCATGVFGSSLNHLTTTPSLYGQPFDAWFSPANLSGPEQATRMLAAIESSPAVVAVTAGISGDIGINGVTVDALAGQSIRGPLLLTPIDGRLPTGTDEIALGATTLSQVGARVGSSVRVDTPLPQGGTRTSLYRVVGRTAFPPDFGTGGLGTGAVTTLDGLLGPQCPAGAGGRSCQLRAIYQTAGAILVKVAPDAAGRATLERLARAYPAAVNYPVPPTNLVNFGESVNFPLILGLVLIAFAVATLLHVLVVSVTRRRREMGLVKSLGFVRSQVAAMVWWQTTTVALVGIVIGVPAGIAIGRLVWQAFAGSLGVLSVPVVAGWVIGAVALGTLAVALLLAMGPALVAARSRPAGLLHSE